MENLYTLINDELLLIVNSVGFDDVNEDTIFPYVTFNFVNSTPLTEGDKEDVIIEIDIWNKVQDGKDTVMDLELITKSIQKKFKKLRTSKNGSFFIFKLMNTLNLKDEDKTIHRRQLRFNVRHYSN